MASQGVNKVILIGNLGKDPDVKNLTNGNKAATISIATSEDWTDKQTGEIQKKTEWHRIVFYGRLVEIVNDYLKKGSKVYIEGKLSTRKWRDKNNVEHYVTEIIANYMQMLGGYINKENDQVDEYENHQSNEPDDDISF